MASLESLLPEEMEQHVQLNRAKLTNYSLLRAEIVRYAEEKQTAISGTVPKESKSPDDVGQEKMETDSSRKGKDKESKDRGKGSRFFPADKGKGKDQDSKGKGKGKDPKGKGKGKDSKGKHKGRDVPSGKGAVNQKNIQCHNCKKWGHYARDCWAKKADDSKGSGGKDPKGKGKGQKLSLIHI